MFIVFSGMVEIRRLQAEAKCCHAGPIVTPVKTGVHPLPQYLDTVFQRYDGRCPSPGFQTRGRLCAGNDGSGRVDF